MLHLLIITFQKLRKQSYKDWMLNHKLSPSFEDQRNNKSCQTEGRNLGKNKHFKFD
jgi:hypothetical protein